MDWFQGTCHRTPVLFTINFMGGSCTPFSQVRGLMFVSRFLIFPSSTSSKWGSSTTHVRVDIHTTEKNGQMSVAHFFANATRCKTSVLPHCFMAISRTNALFSEDLWPTQTSPCWSYHQSFRWSSDQMVGSGWWTNPRNQSENLNKPQVCCLQFFRHG